MASGRILHFADHQVSIDALLRSSLKPSVGQISMSLALLHPESRTKTLRRVSRFLASPAIEREDVRIAACKALVAMLPDSWPVIRDLLQKFTRKRDYEIQFTLFCYLDDFAQVKAAAGLDSVISEGIKDYLCSVPTRKSLAGWMAGDLLGEHWTIAQSLPALLTSARSARFSAGRLAAISGLTKILVRVAPNKRREIRRELRVISRSDRSATVRKSAEWAMATQRKIM